MAGKTVILALAYGKGKQINQPLKEAVEKLVSLEKCSVYTQQDLRLILRLEPGTSVVVANQLDKHISSLAIIEQFAQMARMNSWKNVILVAAKQHSWRCARDLKKILPTVCIKELSVETPYRPDNQSWVTSPIRWWSRELIIRLLPWVLYKKLCR